MKIKKATCHINLQPSNDDISYCINQRKQWLKNNKHDKLNNYVNDWLDQQYKDWSKEQEHNEFIKNIQYNKWFQEHLHIKWINENMQLLTEDEHINWFKEQINIEQLAQKDYKQTKFLLFTQEITVSRKLNYKLAKRLRKKEIYELKQQDKLAQSLWTPIIL